MRFEDLGLDYALLDALDDMRFDEPTPVQEQAIPSILDGRDLIACAQTGTGKTAAFLLPVIQELSLEHKNRVGGLVLAPTRELALQIDQQVQGLAFYMPISSVAIYGGGDGQDWVRQKRAIEHGVELLIATPGKLLSHMNMMKDIFKDLRFLVLDEADRMLDMGFIDDIRRIIKELPTERQTLLFSATMPGKIRTLAREILKDPERITLEVSKPAEGVKQELYLAHDAQKDRLIKHLISTYSDYQSILVFTSTKAKVQQIARMLKKAGKSAKWISSDLEQRERENVLMDFKARKTRVLVATDVLSRGIDIKDIDLVINFDVPSNAEDYVHRVGRTARAKSKGHAITLVSSADMFRMRQIEELIERELPKLPLPEEYGEAPQWRSGGGAKKGGRRNSRGSGSKHKRGAKKNYRGSNNKRSGSRPSSRSKGGASS